MSHTFVVTRDIPCVGVSVRPGAIPKGSMVTFLGSPRPNQVEVSWKGQSVTMLARDFVEKTKIRPLAAVVGFHS